MNEIVGQPNQYDFGLSFSYAVWTEGTKVDLCTVPWNNDYRDVVQFPTPSGVTLKQYIDSRAGAGIHIDNLSYLKPNEPISIDLPFNVVYRYNYLRASNPVQPVPGGDMQRDLYYFILDVQYVAPNTTRLVLQLDIWQTFRDYLTFGRCYVERGHIGMANTNQFNNYGRDYLNIPEGLDYGSEYVVVARHNEPIMTKDTSVGNEAYNIIVLATGDLQDMTNNPGTIDNPRFVTALGGKYAGMPSGASAYIWQNAESFGAWVSKMKETPWVSQSIISITMVPPITRYGIIGWAVGNNPTLVPPYQWLPRSYTMMPDWRNSTDITSFIPDRYKSLKKLFTFPYMVVELTTFTGTPIILKPESWNDPDARVVERINPIPPDQRVAISPYRYNARNDAIADDKDDLNATSVSFPGNGDDHGEYVDLATYLANFPTLALVNNGALQYLASNAHGIAFQYQNADWSQQRALAANQVGYDQASSGMTLANQLTDIATTAASASTDQTNTLITQKAIMGSVTAPIGGLSHGPLGAIGGLASAAGGNVGSIMDINNNNNQVAIRNAQANQSNAASVGNQGFVRDTNKNLADWSAKGDYQQQVAGINAKVQDAKMIQPTTAGQVGGDAMNILNNNAMVSARFKMIDHAAMSVVCEHWLRYGYPVRRFMQPPANLRVMSKFSYWKMSETYIQAADMPETFKQTIRGILEKGVTIWSDPAYIGVTDTADNVPLGGISY